MKYIISPQAYEDLIEIWQFISPDSIEAADDVLNGFTRRFEFIAENPHAGRERPELAPDLRSFPVGRYLIFYHSRPSVVEIARVIHSARDLDAIFTD
jgi:toxin ParE1/3/4